MTDIILIILVSAGTIFILLAAVGILRMPDFYLRVSVTTKAATLGVGLILVASALSFDHFAVTSRVIAIIIFIILTAPVAAHMIGRAAYFIGVKRWEGTKVDDLKGKYEAKTHQLKGVDESEASSKSKN